MMRREVRKYIFDMEEACDQIVQFVAGQSFDDYSTNIMLKSAVERQFMIVGEAMGQMLQIEPKMADYITDCAKIVGLRNRLVHGYGEVSDLIVWGVVEVYLPILRRELAELANAD
jgi:uncharacterized protein with HEPN domain